MNVVDSLLLKMKEKDAPSKKPTAEDIKLLRVGSAQTSTEVEVCIEGELSHGKLDVVVGIKSAAFMVHFVLLNKIIQSEMENCFY